MTSARGYYDEYWAGKGGWRPQASLTPALERFLERWLPEAGRALDIGCGAGSPAAHWLTGRGFEYLGIDVSPEAVAQARSAGLRAEVGDLSRTLRIDDASYDAALCLEVLEHLFDPELVVREARRVLRPRGLFLVSVPNICFWENRISFARGKWRPGGSPLTNWDAPWRDPHVRFYTPRILTMLLARGGFEVEALIGVSAQRIPAYLQERWPALFGAHLLAAARRRDGEP